MGRESLHACLYDRVQPADYTQADAELMLQTPRFIVLIGGAALCVGHSLPAIAQHQYASANLVTVSSDSAVRAKSPRTGDSRRMATTKDDPRDSRRDAAEPMRVMLSPVSVS